MGDLDKADLLFIAILADHIRQRPANWGLADSDAVTEARAIYEPHLGERADPVVTMKMISEARGRVSALQPKIRVKIWDVAMHGREEPEVRDLAFGEVFEFDDQYYSFEPVALVAELPQPVE
jgi:hypothetical protein